MMNKIAILTDTGSGLRETEANQLGISLLPLQIIMDEKAYFDGVNVDTQDVYEYLKRDGMPSTSMPSVGDIEAKLNSLKAQGYTEVLAIPLSSGLSSTMENIQAGARNVGIKLTPIEISTTMMIQKFLVLEAKRLVDQGKNCEEIQAILMDIIASGNTMVLPFNLNHLKRGGRLTPLAAGMASLLKIQPVLHINQTTQGKLDVLEKIRTQKKAMQYVLDACASEMSQQDYQIYVLHSGAQEKADFLRAGFIELGYPSENIEINVISSVIACHTGLDCAAVQVVRKVK